MLHALLASLLTAPQVINHGRKLSFAPILNYAPGSKVTDHARIDLDQSAMESALAQPVDYTMATTIYTTGAHSKPSAVCTLISPATLGQSVAKSTGVSFSTTSGQTITNGKSYQDHEATSTTFTFSYPVSEERVQPDGSACFEGGMAVSDRKSSGCIASDGTGSSTFTINAITYTATCTNRAKRTIQGFSTSAQAKMHDCPTDSSKSWVNGCPYSSYLPYFAYYGAYDYANQLVMAALEGTSTSFRNGNQDLASTTDTGRVEVAKKAAAYMNTWMYVLREFEDAIDDCTNGDLYANAGSSGPVHAWDEGVAFYVGSLMDSDDLTGSELTALDSKGKESYTLANKRCKNYKTCGPDGNDLYGEAKVNFDLFRLFNIGQHNLLIGECSEVVPIKNQINQKMTIPLVQGTLRYAYKIDVLQGGDKEKAEMAVFAAAVLPQLHACSEAHAQTVYDNTHITSSDTDYNAVKAAFESCYSSMGITCAEVGGLWNSAIDNYYNDQGRDASPCIDARAPDLSEGAIAGIAVAGVVMAGMICLILALICKERQGQPLFSQLDQSKARPAKGNPTTNTV